MKIFQSMSVSDLKKPTATDWAKIKALTDEEIDTSDILNYPDAFSHVCPSMLADAVRRGCGGMVSDWAAYQHERYGW